MAGPNDLNVNLTIDASIFQKGLDDAVKQLNEFSAKVKAAGDSVNTTMVNIKKSTDPVSKAFSELGSTIAAIGIGTFIESVVEGGAKMSRLAESVSMTTESVLEYSRAMSSVGKDTNTLVTSFGFMEKAVEGAIQGNTRLRADFSALGIAVTDFNKLSAEEVYEKIARGLAAIQDPARRAQAAYDILGRSVKGVDWVKYVAELDRTKGTMAEAARGADAAASALSSMAKFMNDVKNEILTILSPILMLISYFTGISDEMGAAKLVGIALVAVFTVLTGYGIVQGFMLLKTAIQGVVVSMLALETTMAPIIGWFIAAAAAAATVYAVYQRLTGQVDSLWDGYKKLGNEISEGVASGWKKLTDYVNQNTIALDKNKQASLPISTEKPVDPNAAHIASLNTQLELMIANNKIAKERLEKELSLVSASNSYKAAELEKFDSESKHKTELIRLQGEINKLTAEQGKQGVDHSKEIAILEKMKDEENKRFAGTTGIKGDIVAGTEARKEDIALLNQQAQFEEQIAEIKRKTAELTMTSSQKAQAEVDKETTKRIDAQRKLFQEANGPNYNADTDPKFLKQKAEIEDWGRTQKQVVAESEVQARDWATGWNEAFVKYKDDATNASLTSKKLFDDSTKGMEDAIVNFAKTGKLSFDTLLQNIAEDILRSQIKQLFAGLFNSNGLTSTGGGGSSLFAGVGKLLGFADGGTIPTNGPVMVGENGPEIISGAAGMSVTPNSQIGQSGQNQNSMTNVTYNINATDARSFQQMIAQDPSFLYAVTLRGQNMIPGAAGGL